MKSVIILLMLGMFSLPAHSEEKLTSTESNKDWSFLTDVPPSFSVGSTVMPNDTSLQSALTNSWHNG